ncbi:hypothetical protein GCM10008959_32860 [Deinococcus seoulensis]|uniref:Uncharacterized protein n=1 Tax=Deinococcus seoulensis TaxID=1837379 RepID=A0ABQ2RVB8_9DEIO|nr:hypothetical protein [Deinococcus seoulensis]GGR68193.1 hypothetical protein GCM10008959_32860 [Deinococcus seoulensis]
MTAPAPATLTPEQLASVRTYATAAALNYHDTQVPEGDRVDLHAAWLVHQDLRLVAADVLEAACLRASQAAAGVSAGNVKRVKVDGEVETEFFAATPVDDVTASSWCARAERLRKQASSGAGGSRIVPSPLAGMVVGGRLEPVFRVTRPCLEDA